MRIEQKITEDKGALQLSRPVIQEDSAITVDFDNGWSNTVGVLFTTGPLSGVKISIPAGATVPVLVSASSKYEASGQSVQPVNGEIIINA